MPTLHDSRPTAEHVITASQFDRDSLLDLFATARRMESAVARREKLVVLQGALLGNLFFEPSTRTRLSFGAAFQRLGGSVLDTTGMAFSSMAKGESLRDTARVISGYVDVIVIRHPERGSAAEFAAASVVPVINGGDGPGEHPTQALLDVYTIQKEIGRLDQLVVAFVGDLRYGRTVHSLIRALSNFEGITARLVAPDSLQLPDELETEMTARGMKLTRHSAMPEGLADAHVVYMTRLQKERMPESERASMSADFVLNVKRVDSWCRDEVVIMHPLPRDSNAPVCELSEDLDSDPRLAIFRQTDNGIPVRMALFAHVMGVAQEIP
ncbi:MAG: aspartate carbamoyltransferase [Acidimicrobiia bacterium]